LQAPGFRRASTLTAGDQLPRCGRRRVVGEPYGEPVLDRPRRGPVGPGVPGAAAVPGPSRRGLEWRGRHRRVGG